MLSQYRVAGAPLAARWQQLNGYYRFLIVATGLVMLLAMLSRLTGPIDVHDVHSHIGNDLPWQGRENATLAGGIPIRLMFIGASIALGDPEHAGYRKQIRDWIVGLGNPVNCVGSNRFGNLKDNDVEAFTARRVKDLTAGLPAIVPQTRPNLVLVHAGASDCFQDPAQGSSHALDHTQALAEYLFEAGDTSPHDGGGANNDSTEANNTTAAAATMVAVILSTLVASPNPEFERCIQSFNAQIRQVVTDLAREGRHIALAEMHLDQGLPGRPGLEDIQDDGMLPTRDGWRMMGEVFKTTIRLVEHKGWLRAPVDNGTPADGDTENGG
ncbi:carbohydrate esterase family 3 protein [Apiospora rasikravindrae]|uniref:Carbohydrate esterase family 3 protein n=1 Tax=Apiospora rasikravindrae TaxID=990691 RepID=A0ABR1RMA1_9PEZI